MSGLWSSEYFASQMGEEDIERQEQEQDGRTALDRTIDRIGMGASASSMSLQYGLTFIACSFRTLPMDVVRVMWLW